jgi:hypothetical protein
VTNIFGSGIAESEGKIVIFETPSLRNYKFHLEEEITLRFSSSFQSLVDAALGKGLVLGAETLNQLFGTSIPSAGFQQLGFQQWSGTEPLSFSFNVLRFLETSGFNDVIIPFQELANLAIPKLLNDGNGGLEAPGPAAINVILEKKAVSSRKQPLNIKLGPVYLRNCVIQEVEPTFSNEVDTLGYPIWVKMKISAKTVFTANDSMVYGLFQKF